MPVICLGLNHKTAPLYVRERFSLIEAQLSAALQALIDQPGIDESLILSTCNRTEVYVYSENLNMARESLYKYLFLIHKITAKQIEKYFYFLTDKNAVKHLFSVASGLDSMILGEGQILGQVRKAYKYAKHYNSVKNTLNNLFLRAIKTGKRARAETNICRGASSLSFAAIELIRKKVAGLNDKNALVIGTGKMGRQAIAFLKESGIKKICLTNRSYEKALKIARDIPGVPVKFENLYEAVMDADIIISSTSSPHFILTKDRLKRAAASTNYKPIFIVDIAVPRDVDPEVKKIKNITLYNVDDLGEIVNNALHFREAEVEKVKNIIEEEKENFTQIINSKKAVPIIQNMQKRCETILDEMIKQAGAEEKEKFKRFGSKLIGKILHQPIIKIKKFSGDEKFNENLDYIKEIFG